MVSNGAKKSMQVSCKLLNSLLTAFRCQLKSKDNSHRSSRLLEIAVHVHLHACLCTKQMTHGPGMHVRPPLIHTPACYSAYAILLVDCMTPLTLSTGGHW